MTNVEIEQRKSEQAAQMKAAWRALVPEYVPTDFDFGVWVRKYKKNHIMFVIKAVVKRRKQEQVINGKGLEQDQILSFAHAMFKSLDSELQGREQK